MQKRQQEEKLQIGDNTQGKKNNVNIDTDESLTFSQRYFDGPNQQERDLCNSSISFDQTFDIFHVGQIKEKKKK